MSMLAVYRKTIFKDESCGYCICSYRTKDADVPPQARDPLYAGEGFGFIAAGYLLPENSALEVELTGNWKKNRYGLQLAVESCHERIPSTCAGIAAYLSSGLLKGIGPQTAKAITDRFGTDALRVLEQEPQRLLEIRGISPRRLETIVEGYRASAALRNLVEQLAPFGVTTNKCVKIQKTFGDKAVSIVRKEPYRLCKVEGFGFKTVDAIARRLGCSPKDPQRLQGALLFALEEGAHNGHTFLPQEELCRQAADLLNEGFSPCAVRPQDLPAALYRLSVEGELVIRKDRVYQNSLYKAEQATAHAVAELLRAPVPTLPDVEQALAESQQELGLMLSERQCEAVRTCFSNGLSVITGGPGTGKTTVLRVILDLHDRLESGPVLQAAPTSIAAKRMRESTGRPSGTLHSALGLVGGKDVLLHLGGAEPLDASFVVVDEMSMVDLELAKELFTHIRPGTRVLLVGDADQLPSVGPGRVFRDLMESGSVPVTRLDMVFRQSGVSRIALNAQSIQRGETHLLYGDDFRFLPCNSEAEAAELIWQQYLQETARRGPEQVQVLTPFRKRGLVSAAVLSPQLRDMVNPPSSDKRELRFGEKLFRTGDRVVQLHNRDGICNGDTGRILAITKDPETDSTLVEIDFGDGRVVRYGTDALDTVELAYAMTIHKSQGSEYQTVILPLLSSAYIMLQRNLVYTGITRAKKRVILVGQKQALFMAIHRQTPNSRHSVLANEISMLFSEKEV